MTSTNLVANSPAHFTKTASSRALSPARSPSPTARRMPSPRTSPALRPQSPLSPRYDSPRFDSLQPPSSRTMHSRTGNSQRRANTNSLKLPSLPRFHPANYPSAHSSVQTTPEAGTTNSPQPPMSPRTHQRFFSDAQKHLLAYQHEMVSVAVRTSSPPIQPDKPRSPKLAPLGSPGPVTPLELEAEGGYLVVGARSAGDDISTPDELVDNLIRKETGGMRSSQSSSRSTSR